MGKRTAAAAATPAAPVEPETTTPAAAPAPAAAAETKPTKGAAKGAFHVFDGRSNLVAYATDEAEAAELATKHGGTYKKLN